MHIPSFPTIRSKVPQLSNRPPKVLEIDIKGRFLRRDGPRLLVVDEYQLLADPIRGMNYELILSLAPPETQILLLSGSVANPGDVVRWLERIGRNVALVLHQERPVRLEEIMLNDIPVQAPTRLQTILNLNTARVLGIVVPPSMPSIADEVIE